MKTVSEQETTQGEKQKITRSRDREAGTGACEISPTLSALEETQNIKDSHRHGLRNFAREKAKHKRSPNNEMYHLGQYGDTKKPEGECRNSVLVRLRHRTTRAAVRVLRAHLHGLR